MELSFFSHNLSLSIIDIEGHSIAKESILEQIKNRITEMHGINMTYNGVQADAIFHWKRVSLDEPFSNMMGDLFIECPYLEDEIVYSHTKQLLYEIDNEMKIQFPSTQWCLVFHLSRLPRTTFSKVF